MTLVLKLARVTPQDATESHLLFRVSEHLQQGVKLCARTQINLSSLAPLFQLAGTVQHL